MSQPIELILARNLISNLVTPALLTDADGSVILYNTAAAVVVGQHFEEIGRLSAQEWTDAFDLRSADGHRVSPEELPLMEEVEAARPAQGRFRFRAASGRDVKVDVTAVPLVGADGRHGAIVFLTPVGEPLPEPAVARGDESAGRASADATVEPSAG